MLALFLLSFSCPQTSVPRPCGGQSTLVSVLVGLLRSPAHPPPLLSSFPPSFFVGTAPRSAAQQSWGMRAMRRRLLGVDVSAKDLRARLAVARIGDTSKASFLCRHESIKMPIKPDDFMTWSKRM